MIVQDCAVIAALAGRVRTVVVVVALYVPQAVWLLPENCCSRGAVLKALGVVGKVKVWAVLVWL